MECQYFSDDDNDDDEPIERSKSIKHKTDHVNESATSCNQAEVAPNNSDSGELGPPLTSQVTKEVGLEGAPWSDILPQYAYGLPDPQYPGLESYVTYDWYEEPTLLTGVEVQEQTAGCKSLNWGPEISNSCVADLGGCSIMSPPRMTMESLSDGKMCMELKKKPEDANENATECPSLSDDDDNDDEPTKHKPDHVTESTTSFNQAEVEPNNRDSGELGPPLRSQVTKEVGLEYPPRSDILPQYPYGPFDLPDLPLVSYLSYDWYEDTGEELPNVA